MELATVNYRRTIFYRYSQEYGFGIAYRTGEESFQCFYEDGIVRPIGEKNAETYNTISHVLEGSSRVADSWVKKKQDAVKTASTVFFCSKEDDLSRAEVTMAGQTYKVDLTYSYFRGRECSCGKAGCLHRAVAFYTVKERAAMTDDFNNGGEADVFLISLKAGGTGLNLTGADTVVHLDPWWNVSAENQATDRTHRIGQQRNVEVIKLIAENSIEQRVIELQQLKKDVADRMIAGDDSSITGASLEDIAFILRQ